MAKSAFVLCALFAFATGEPLVRKTDCGSLCDAVFCVPRKPEECNPQTEVFVERNGDCYCCDACVKKVDRECQPEHCKTVCRDVASKTCFDQGMAFAPRDGCTCCDSCV